MKKETCPFCGNRWTRADDENPVVCPSCNSELPTEWINRPRLY